MIRSLSAARQLFAFDRAQSVLYGFFRRSRPATAADTSELMVIQCVEDLYYYGIFGQIANSLRVACGVRVELFVMRSLNVGESKSIFSFALARLVKNRVHNLKWTRLYRSVCDGMAYRSDSIRPISDIVDLLRAWKSWRTLSDKHSLIALAIDGVQVGDLINDSYIRFKPAPTVHLRDIYMLTIIWQSYRDVRRAKNFFESRRPRLFLTSYSSYIQHGVAVRVAIQSGVCVYSFGEYQEFSKHLDTLDWFHTIDPDHLSADFAKMDRQEERKAAAQAALGNRLSGGIDAATVYMKQSAYVDTGTPVPDVKDAVIVFLHDFYDSPHIYRDMVFSDFWDWVCFTVEVLKSAGIRFYLKPHPNQIQLNDDVLADLQKRYPDVVILSTKISNIQLVNGGMAAAVTVYGSVANEMAYLGVPTICCSRHAHSSFDFCATAKSKDEYAAMLRAYRKKKLAAQAMREQSLAFYYMFNYGKREAERNLTDTAMEFRLKVRRQDSSPELPGLLQDIAQKPAYAGYIENWRQALVRASATADPPQTNGG